MRPPHRSGLLPNRPRRRPDRLPHAIALAFIALIAGTLWILISWVVAEAMPTLVWSMAVLLFAAGVLPA